MTLNNIRNSRTSVDFTVSGLALSGFSYASSGNHDPDGESNGATITVNKP